MLLAANIIIVANAQQQQPPQQQQTQLQSSSGGGGGRGVGLTATINGDSFTTGETIMISGSVAQRGPSSNVIIEITDPQGQLVKRGFPALTPTDNTFTYTFVAGEIEQFDTNAPMVASGNYLVKVRYFPSSGSVVADEVELSFGYNASNTPAAASADDGTNTTAGSIESEAASITPASSQSAPTQNATSTTTGATSNFHSTNDSFSIDVPVGWLIQDLNNTGSVLSEESTQGYGILAQLCREVEEQQGQGGAATVPNSSNNSIGSCQTAQEEVIHVIRYPNLDNDILAANTVTNGVTTPTTGATFNTNNIGNSTTATTIDNILAYHLQKLQQVGYNSIQIVNNADTSVNLTMAQSNQTMTTLPAKFAEMIYTTASAPDETRRGYFLLTATNATAPNLGITKGYSVFYEGNSTISAGTTSANNSSAAPTPLPEAVRQVFDSFELVTAAGAATTITTQTEPLTVEIIASDTEDTAPSTFEFEAEITGGLEPYTISWDFDDGSVEEDDEEVEHTFDEAGSYSVSLAVTDSRGQSAFDSIEITVEEPPVEEPPVEEQPPAEEEPEEEGNDSVDVDGVVDDFIDDLFGRLGLR